MRGATCGGKGLKERTRESGERPIGATSFRQQNIKVSCPSSTQLALSKPGQSSTVFLLTAVVLVDDVR